MNQMGVELGVKTQGQAPSLGADGHVALAMFSRPYEAELFTSGNESGTFARWCSFTGSLARC